MGGIGKGAVYQWSGGDVPGRGVDCVVHRVARDGTWADFTMTRGGSSWGKRMPLPLPESFVRVRV
jgi:hypothetical protein